MQESERHKRWKENYRFEECINDADILDREISDRIFSLLNHPQIDDYCMVDAYYYDYSEIPDSIEAEYNLWRDAYLIYGITTQGEMVTKWVDRYDLDSKEPIIDGKVIHSNNLHNDLVIPEINQCFNPNLLSTPMIDLTNFFPKKVHTEKKYPR